jgi:hypothetical protein
VGQGRRTPIERPNGPCRGLRLVRGMRRALTEDEQRRIAGAIVEHLEESNWKIEQGPVREGHGQSLMSK